MPTHAKNGAGKMQSHTRSFGDHCGIGSIERGAIPEPYFLSACVNIEFRSHYRFVAGYCWNNVGGVELPLFI